MRMICLIIISALSLFFNATAFAEESDLCVSWDDYPTPIGHNIEVNCGINDAPIVKIGETPATENDLCTIVDAVSEDTATCDINALRLSDNVPSLHSQQVTSGPFPPSTPTGIGVTLRKRDTN